MSHTRTGDGTKPCRDTVGGGASFRRTTGRPAPKENDQTPAPLPSVAELQLLFAALNARYFGGSLGAYGISFNPRLTAVAGRIAYRRRSIELSAPLLRVHPEHVTETLLHEMIHAWLHENRLPAGHGRHFKEVMRAVGLTSIYHSVPVTERRSRRRYVLTCPHCKTKLVYRRRPGRPISCARCSPGGFDPRVAFHIRRVA